MLFSTHASLVDEVNVVWIQNDSTHGSNFATLRRRFLGSRRRERKKERKKEKSETRMSAGVLKQPSNT